MYSSKVHTVLQVNAAQYYFSFRHDLNHVSRIHYLIGILMLLYNIIPRIEEQKQKSP